MHVLSAAGDTWGISGPTFLGFYVTLAVIAIIATVLARRSLARSHAPAPAPHLDNPYDVAYLHLGRELTVLTALSAMHVAGRIAPSGRRRVRAVGAVGPDAGELQRAIHLSAQDPVLRAELPGAPPVAEALGRIERRLIDAGLLLTAEQRERIRRTGWMLWAVAAVGASRLITGIMAGKPSTFLLGLLAVVALVALSLTAPRRTDRGNAELTRLRTARASLSLRLKLNWRVYGPAGAALGVAVFGASALWAADPAFAEELNVPTLAGGGDGGGGCGGCGG